MPSLRIVTGLLFAYLSLPWIGVLADDLDQESARRLVEEGSILPLERILDTLRDSYPGRVLEVGLETEHGRWVYEIELLDAKGTVWEVEVDAATGAVLERERED